jgi:exodeoxyribonuclease V alpha subunit
VNGVQDRLNPPAEIRVERFGWAFCRGDKVMQVENDYDKDVYNGDLGVVSRIDMEEGRAQRPFRRPRRQLRLWRAG